MPAIEISADPSSLKKTFDANFISRSGWQLIVLLNVFVAVTAFCLLRAPFAYPLDDTYIHMAIARTLVQSHVWGVQPFEAASASSSPLYTIILACFFRLLPSERLFYYVPLALNVAAMVGVIALWARMLGDQKYAFFALAVLSVATPAFMIPLIGMEHSIQILTAIYLAWRGSIALAEHDHRFDTIVLVFMLSMLAVGSRYEALALVVALLFIAITLRNFAIAAALVLGSLATIFGFGLIWVREGGWLLPNSLLLKPLPDNGSLPVRLLLNLGHNTTNIPGATTLAVALSVFAAIFWRYRKSRLRSADALSPAVDWRLIFAASAVLTTAAQLVFGTMGFLFRYEAWLISLDVLSVVLLLGTSFSPRFQALALVGLCLITLPRAAQALVDSVLAGNDRKLEHFATADFLAKYYSGKTVVLNDIGVAAWKATDTRIADIFGLANNTVTAIRMKTHQFTPTQMESWAKSNGADVAILEVCWEPIKGSIPEDWHFVGLWRIPRNAVYRHFDIAFFAADSTAATRLESQMKAFSVDKSVEIYFTDDRSSPIFGKKASDFHGTQCNIHNSHGIYRRGIEIFDRRAAM